MTISANNKRIVKNTLMLYVRMVLIMLVSLYTSRVILQKLGVQDYGIYNVVGGVVSMLAFLNSTLSATCQRYFSYELGCGNRNRLSELFCLNMTVFLYFILVVLVLAETLGVWFVNTKLTIPPERMVAMNWAYQFSIFTFVVSSLSIPYNALIISHERMSVYAYISIIEVLLKLGVVFSLGLAETDRLILYAGLLFVSTSIITFTYYLYCRKNYPESRYVYLWQRKKLKEIANYSSWHFLGAFSNIVRDQGVNILLNVFFNPVVNAARAIAFQVSTGVSGLTHSFFTAAKPQIYKLYGANDLKNMYSLVERSSKMCFFLVALIAYPLLVNTEYVLALWLGKIPEYTLFFTQLVLIHSLIDSVSGPAIASALATGRIRGFELISGGLTLLNLPVSYILLVLGYDPYSTMFVVIFLTYLTVVVRAFILKKLLGFSVRSYLNQIVLRLTLVGLIIPLPVWGLNHFQLNGFLYLVISTCFVWLMLILSFYYFVVKREERELGKVYFIGLLHRIRKV